MIRVGIVGIGFMGMIHHLAYQRVRGAKVTAICSRDPKKLAGDWRGIKGNFGPPGSQVDLSGVRRYQRLEDLLADKSIDLIDICLPPALHARAAIESLRAGKHVLCEKPIALLPQDAERMTKAARQAGRLLMVAHVLPFFPEFGFALKAARQERFGKLLGGHFKRIISDPSWLGDFYDPNVVGGPVVDLHIHDTHFIRLLAGMPRQVFSTGRLHAEGSVVEFVNTQFLYDGNCPTITAASGVIHQQGRGFTHGFELYFERATLVFDFADFATGPATTPLTILDANGKARQPRLSDGDPVAGFVAELKEACRAVQSGKASPILSGELARDALLICDRESRSVRQRRPVSI